MSFRELRDFTEILRFLGYPRFVSIENFRKPNFPLVAEILRWLIIRFNPTLNVPSDIQTEQDRVIFVKTCAQIIATKTFIKLNTKKLFYADGYAVQELLKMATIFYKAAKNVYKDDDYEENLDITQLTNIIFHEKANDLKRTRQLASNITEKGALLSDLLDQEIKIRERRNHVLLRQLDINELEKIFHEQISEIEKEIGEVNFRIENVASDEANLDIKIEKRKEELERYQKRLDTLKTVRPAFMDEYEKLEEELAIIYETYVDKFRCLVYLEQQWEELEKTENDQIEARKDNIRKMVEQMKVEESLKIEENEEKENDLSIEDKNDSNIRTETERRNTTSRARVFGSMGEFDESLDSDLDLGDDGSDLDTEDEREILNMKDINNGVLNDDSDNDF